MKTKLLITIFVLITSLAQAAQDYGFEELSEKKASLPPKISEILRGTEAEDLEDCRRQLQLTAEEMADYFTAVPIDLGGHQATLVLPTKYCYAFFGAHSVSFWIFDESESGFRMILSGRQDGLRILDTKTHGLADIETFYGVDAYQYEYNGNSYVKVSR